MNKSEQRIADVRRDAPEQLWLLQLILDNRIPLNPHLEAVAALKQAILKKSGSETQWRLLCHSKQQDFDLILNHPIADPKWRTFRQWLFFLDQVGAKRQLPEPVTRLLLNALIVHIEYLVDSAYLTEMYPVEVLRIMVRECLDRDTQRIDLLERFAAEEVALVLEWASDIKVQLDRNQQKAGWRHLLRRAREWRERKLATALLDTESVPTLIDQMASGPYVAKSLNTPYLLWEEGFAMQHCVGKLWKFAASGESQFFSIRRREDEARAATVEIQESANGKWTVFDCRTRFNCMAPPELMRVGITLADAYTNAAQKAA